MVILTPKYATQTRTKRRKGVDNIYSSPVKQRKVNTQRQNRPRGR